MQKAFPAHFPDFEREAAERLQRALLVELDEALEPEDGSLDARRKGAEKEFIDSIKPPIMAGPGNLPDAIREGYRRNFFDLLHEGLQINHSTPSYEFWDYITRLEDKYRKQSK